MGRRTRSTSNHFGVRRQATVKISLGDSREHDAKDPYSKRPRGVCETTGGLGHF